MIGKTIITEFPNLNGRLLKIQQYIYNYTIYSNYTFQEYLFTVYTHACMALLRCEKKITILPVFNTTQCATVIFSAWSCVVWKLSFLDTVLACSFT